MAGSRRSPSPRWQVLYPCPLNLLTICVYIVSYGLAYLQCQGGMVGQRHEHSLALSYLFIMTAGFT